MRYVFNNDQRTDTLTSENSTRETSKSSSSKHDDSDSESEEYEVEKLVDICYGDPDNTGKDGLKFKVWQEALCCNYVVDRTLLLRVLRMFFSPLRTSKTDILHFFASL